MKNYQLMIVAVTGLAASAMAGTESVPPPAPMQAPVSDCVWFVGASYGRVYDVGASFDTSLNFNQDLGDMVFDMYSFQVGHRFSSGLYGFDASLYLEVAYLNGDVNYNIPTGPGSFSPLNIDVDIVPVTLNGMIERNIYGGFGAYLGGGLGYGFTEVDALNNSESDGGFYAQVSAGLTYKFTEQFELFGGGRWVYLNSLDFGNSTFELDDGFGWEAGLRFNF